MSYVDVLGAAGFIQCDSDDNPKIFVTDDMPFQAFYVFPDGRWAHHDMGREDGVTEGHGIASLRDCLAWLREHETCEPDVVLS